MENFIEASPSLIRAITQLREAIHKRPGFPAHANSSAGPAPTEIGEPPAFAIQRQPEALPAFDPPEFPKNCHPAQLALTITTNEWVQLVETEVARHLWFATEGIVFDSRHTRIDGAHSKLTFAAPIEDILGQADPIREYASPGDDDSRREPDRCPQSCSFPDGDALLTAGPSVVRLARLNTGGGIFSASIAAAVVAGTGRYEGCTGTATFSLSAHLKPWLDETELRLLLSGFEALVIAEFRVVLSEET